MKIDYPAEEQLPQLKELWKEAFGDSDGFISGFFDNAFAADRCRCVTEQDRLAAALYWFDCRYQDRPLAYVYAVATAKAFRGQGICRALMENTAKHLQNLGYAGILLVPARGLFEMYGKMGYETCCSISEISCTAGQQPVLLQRVDMAAYADMRKRLLPEEGVVQEGENLSFLSAQAELYAGDDFLLAASSEEDGLVGLELLGNTAAAPGILAALGKIKGKFRIPGKESPFAMYHPLSEGEKPGYFGLAFD